MDFSDVDDAILKRYMNYHKLTLPAASNGPAESRQELEEAVSRHFATWTPDPNERDSITSFLYTLRNHVGTLGGSEAPRPGDAYCLTSSIY